MNERPDIVHPWRYFRRRHEDPPLKWVTIAAGWAMIAIGIWDLVGGVWLYGLAVIALSANLLTTSRLARSSYRRGYFESRQLFWQSHLEARHRGMDMEDWLEGERDRDRAMFMQMVIDP